MVKWETVRKHYKKRMEAAATEIAVGLRKLGYSVSGPNEFDCDSYSWHLSVTHPEYFPTKEQSVDVCIELVDSQDHDGFEGGYTFCLDITQYGGLAPFNYSADCWVKTLPAIKERWEVLSNAIDVYDVAQVIAV